MTKEEFLMETLREIEEQSTRHQRGTNENFHLEGDLRKIEELVGRAKTILTTPKDIYSDGEVKYVYHQEFMNGIGKIYEERQQFKKDKQTNPSKNIKEITKNYQSNSFSSSEYLDWEDLNGRWKDTFLSITQFLEKTAEENKLDVEALSLCYDKRSGVINVYKSGYITPVKTIPINDL